MLPSLNEGITRAYYRTTAQRSHVASREYYERAADALKLWLRPWLPDDSGARCLDLACGCGEMVYLLEREGFRHTSGVDLCREEIEQGRMYLSGALIEADVLDYLRECDDESVDFITALNFLEHLPKDELFAILSQIRRILTPGGSLVALVPNAMSPFGTLTRHWDMTHEWAFTPNNFQQLAALTGFDSKVDFRECSPAPHGIISAVRYCLWRIIHAGIALWLLIEVGTKREGIYTMNMMVRLQVPSQ